MRLGNRVVALLEMPVAGGVGSGDGLFRKKGRPPELFQAAGCGGETPWAFRACRLLLAGLAGTPVAHRLYGTGGAFCLCLFLRGPPVA
jgi:hypothetical protein